MHAQFSIRRYRHTPLDAKERDKFIFRAGLLTSGGRQMQWSMCLDLACGPHELRSSP